MNYATGTTVNQFGATNADTKPSTISDDAATIVSRLVDLRSRISNLGDCLHGPVPRDVATGKDAPGPVSSVRSAIDSALRMLNEIDGELSRVQSRL